MTRANFIAASTLVVLAAASPAMAQTRSGSGTTSGTSGGKTRGTAPSRSALPNSALTTSSVASPFAWLDDAPIPPTATAVGAVSWYTGGDRHR
jgi:hypothetical protein